MKSIRVRLSDTSKGTSRVLYSRGPGAHTGNRFSCKNPTHPETFRVRVLRGSRAIVDGFDEKTRKRTAAVHEFVIEV